MSERKHRGWVNHEGLIVSKEVFPANGMAERAATMAMLERIPGGRRVHSCAGHSAAFRINMAVHGQLGSLSNLPVRKGRLGTGPNAIQ
jgi:hypothetical protein